jgi:hypothetical protein
VYSSRNTSEVIPSIPSGEKKHWCACGKAGRVSVGRVAKEFMVTAY